MRHIKKFESFITDDNRGESSYYPKYNQGNSIKAKDYVDQLMKVDFKGIFKKFDIKLPENEQGEEFDKVFDFVKDKAIKYYTDHPDEIENTDVEMDTYPFNGGDGIARVQNMGGVMESNLPNPNSENCDRLQLSTDEMNLFSKKTQLINLIRNNKVLLRDKEVWYNNDDIDTIKKLDLFFEI